MTPEVRLNIEVESLQVPITAYYAVSRPTAEYPVPPALVVALHGWGQNCKKMLRELAPLGERNIVVAAPQAPHPFYLDMGAGKVGFNWLTRYERDRAVADNNTFISRLLDELRKKAPYDERRVFLLGFSQGCSMAWRFSVSGNYPVAGMIACGADLPADVAEKLPLPQQFPTLFVHGTDDPIVSVSKMHEARGILAEKGAPFTVHEFEGEHGIPANVAREIGAWIVGH